MPDSETILPAVQGRCHRLDVCRVRERLGGRARAHYDGPMRAGAWLLVAAAALAGCAAPRAARVPPTPAAVILGAEQVGQASWYGHPYHGRRTASGEIYDMHRLTAAHPTLPFDARVRVTDLRDGVREVEVRINDRGPFVDGRVIDLSYAAARKLDAVRAGVIPVRLRVVGLPGDAAPARAGAWTVQVGAFADPERARRLAGEMARLGEPVAVTPGARDGVTYHRVHVGRFADRADAARLAGRLAGAGHRVLVVEAE